MLIGSVVCFILSAWIWWSHIMEFAMTGHIHHANITDITGIQGFWKQTTLCLALPFLGCVMFYAFLLIWGVGAYRGKKRADRNASAEH